MTDLTDKFLDIHGLFDSLTRLLDSEFHSDVLSEKSHTFSQRSSKIDGKEIELFQRDRMARISIPTHSLRLEFNMSIDSQFIEEGKISPETTLRTQIKNLQKLMKTISMLRGPDIQDYIDEYFKKDGHTVRQLLLDHYKDADEIPELVPNSKT